MRIFTAALAVSLAVPLSTLSAQQPLSVGERVRVTQCHSVLNSGDVCERSVGTLSALSANIGTLRVEDEATELVFALDSLEVVRGQKRRVGRGMLMGLAIGGGGGALVGAIAMANTSCEYSCDGGLSYGAIFGAVLGIPAGFLVGGVVGALTKTDRWEQVPLDRLRVSFAPQRDGFALGLSVSF